MNKLNSIFFGGRYSKTSKNTSDLIKFCCQLSNRFVLEIYLNDYPLTKKEYKEKAIKDIYDLYKSETDQLREKYIKDINYKNELLRKYGTEAEVEAYFNRLVDYNLVELSNVDNYLKACCESANTKKYTSKAPHLSMNPARDKQILENSLIESKFTYLSHCTIGGDLYKVYNFRLDTYIYDYLSECNDIFEQFHLGELLLENPAFYYDDREIASICSHEGTGVLFLNQEETEKFKLLDIEYC